MQLDHLLHRQTNEEGCIANCPEPEPCNCNENQECIIINRDCNICSQTTCIAKKGSSRSGGGVSTGALAGGIVAAIVFLSLSVALYFWYRRRAQSRKSTAYRVKKDKPAPAADVLNRPDPEKLTISSQYPPPQAENIDPQSHGTVLPPPHRPYINNPFDDSNSIQTTNTEGTNAIPIALVSTESHHSKADTDTLPSTLSADHSRQDPSLNLDHVNVSHDALRVPYPNSTISGISGISRNSFMSNASYSSDFLNEAPVIVTANTRQVMNVVKAEVVNAGALTPPPDGGPKSSSLTARPTIKSPLASSSFGPGDVLREVDERTEGGNPFDDVHSTTAQGSTSPTVKAFDQSSSRPESTTTTASWAPDGPTLPWARSDDSRPSSVSTQPGSIINIGSATRVNVGLSGLASPVSTSSVGGPRAPYRTTMGRLVSPLSGNSQTGTLQDQQTRALAHAQAHVQGPKRISASSAVSATSTRADSILEAFPFVPPSPISDRPMRSPPVSPLGKQSFTASNMPQPIVTVAPPSPLTQQGFKANATADDNDNENLPAPPDRYTLGLSTGSQLSTTSTGLGSFPFQFESGARSGANSSRPSTQSIRQRASLDTLALTSDLASYPLDFEHLERDSIPLPSPRKT